MELSTKSVGYTEAQTTKRITIYKE